MSKAYDPAKLSIRSIPLNGVRIDRVHGKEYRVEPRFYGVVDKNLATGGEWIVELHRKLVARSSGEVQDALIVRPALAPRRASSKMVSLTRQSIMIVPATKGKYEGRPYAHISFRQAQSFGGRRTASRGEKDALPEWFLEHYKRKLRLRATVQGKIHSDDAVGIRLSKFHDAKQVLIFDEWKDEDFIRFFFIVRVYANDQGFTFESSE
ncbi:MAG: hypothetical protein AB7G76_09545 [Steroidobacteraceae bacterium]